MRGERSRLHPRLRSRPSPSAPPCPQDRRGAVLRSYDPVRRSAASSRARSVGESEVETFPRGRRAAASSSTGRRLLRRDRPARAALGRLLRGGLDHRRDAPSLGRRGRGHPGQRRRGDGLGPRLRRLGLPTLMISTQATDDGNGALVTLRAATPLRVRVLGRHRLLRRKRRDPVRRRTRGGTSDGGRRARGPRGFGAPRDRRVQGQRRVLPPRRPHPRRVLRGRAWSGEEVRRRMERTAPNGPAGAWSDEELEWRVLPFLTWPAPDAVSVVAETSVPTSGTPRSAPRTARNGATSRPSARPSPGACTSSARTASSRTPSTSTACSAPPTHRAPTSSTSPARSARSAPRRTPPRASSR